MKGTETVLIASLIISIYLYTNKVSKTINLPNNIITLQESTKIIESRGEDIVVVFTSGPKFNSSNQFARFIDETLFGKLNTELGKRDITFVVLNTTCLARTEVRCTAKFTDIALSIAKLKPIAVVYAGIDSGIAANSFESIIKSESIPIYIIGTRVAIANNVYIGPDNVKLGKSAYEGLKKYIEPNQEALYVETVRIVAPHDKLDNGYPRINSARQLFEKAGVKTRETLFTVWNNEQTYLQVRVQLLREGPVEYIIVPSGETAIGASKAVTELGYKGKVKIVALDFTEETLDLLKRKEIYGIVSQELNKQSVALSDIITTKRKPNTKEILFASDLITLENVYKFYDDEGNVIY